MRILALVMGGRVTNNPAYGITEDTGGHITYVLGAMRALARHDNVTAADIVTRLFEEPRLGKITARSAYASNGGGFKPFGYIITGGEKS